MLTKQIYPSTGFEFKLEMRSNQFQTIQAIKLFEWFESLKV
jgi:hypothetical protein